MIRPIANHTKPEFLIHLDVHVHWGITDTLATVNWGACHRKTWSEFMIKKLEKKVFWG